MRAGEPTVAREFDESGRLQAMSDAAGSVSYGYDERGRLSRVQRQGAPAIGFVHDLQNRMTRLQVGDFYRIDYGYDFLGRLESMKTPAGTVKYEYQTGQGRVIRTLPNGVKTIWEYEPNGRLKQITHADSRNAIVAQYTYQYRADGRIAAIREVNGGQQAVKSYEYDVVGRLVKASGPSGQHAYEYDAVGNRTKATTAGKPAQTYTYDWAGRLKTVDGAPTEHDAAGNLTSLTIGGATIRYRHNQDGQLAEVVDAKVTYRYDGDGNLISRHAPEGETAFVPDPLATIWRPLVMTGKGGQRTLLVWEGNIPLMMIRDGKAEFLLHDHLGSQRLLTDAQGRIAGQLDYEPFGDILALRSVTNLSVGFAGLFWDLGSNIYLSRARAYVPLLARFLEIDPLKRAPIGSQDTFSVFTYSHSDPINLVDREGREARKPRAPFVVNQNPPRLPIEFPDEKKALGETVPLTQSQIGNLLAQYDSYRDKYFSDRWWIAKSDRPRYEREANAYAWKMFATEHSGVPQPFIGKKFPEIRNQELASQLGQFSLDWATSLYVVETNPLLNWFSNSFRTDQVLAPFASPLDGELNFYVDQKGKLVAHPSADTQYVLGDYGAYFFWKDFWIANRAEDANYGSFQTLYPSSNIIAVKVNRFLSDGGSLHDLQLAPPTASSIGGGPKAVLDVKGIDPQSLERARELADVMMTKIRGAQGVIKKHEISGGDWRVAGPGGMASPESYAALREYRELSRTSPSRVGGVWLGGSGQTLAGAGLFDGVALDRNHNLVLIGKGGGEIKLPPLRLDDVVTIFRSVYLHGEGPSVTIDPNPENPEGSAMIVRHGKATENTYVGWVLYHADRLMKGYTLGIDNLTGKDVSTGVPGYAAVLDTIFFGGESPEKLRQQGHWQRFWIVPAETRRLSGPKKELTLFDMPLAVRTQSMKWDKGKLVDDPQGKSSRGALAFKNWFTANYDAVAGERLLTPPRESGITSPVPVFTELRRIALITAIAEKLRDQGVPLPFWMRDYEVRPVPFDKTTPGLQVTKTKSNVVARIYGGVDLSVPDKDRKTYTTASEVPAAAKDAPALREKLTLAAALEKGDWPLAAQSEPMKLRALARGGANHQAVALPGADTQALAPARLEEVDLVAPVTGREPIRLVRSYNSFFNPKGPWGSGWALDLPRLEAIQVPLDRNENSVRFQTGYELVTPLNSARARFMREEPVAELGGGRLLVPDVPGEFYGVADASPDFLSGPTRVLLRKDAGRWHFSKSGELVAIEDAGSRVVYERDQRGRLTRIVGLLGKRPVASIALRYDNAGRIEGASAKTDQREVAVRYEYDANGRLAAVASDAGRTGYRYDGSLLTAVTRGGAGKDAKQSAESVVQRFEYGPRGQLRAEVGADGGRTEYRVKTEAGESSVSAAYGSGKNAREDVVRYDSALRPLEAKYADGTKVAWSYPAGGGTVVDLTPTTGGRIRMSEAADQRSRTVDLDGKRKLVSQVDAAGRLTSLADNGQILLRQTWSPDGRLQTAGDESSTAHFEYNADGLLARVLLAPPGESGKFRIWQATRLDPAGRPVEVTDYTGLQASTDYDDRGRLRARLVKRDGKNYGFELARDDAGRVREVKSSWDTSRYAYDSAGLLSRSEVEASGQKSWAEWKAGRLQKVRQFDGGETTLSYHTDARRAGLPKEIVTPNRLALGYDYDAGNRLAQVTVGRNYRLLLDYDPKGRLAQWSYAAPKP
ncbi:RHS repeat-associated core domain-containing protein [Accumulibacter sp.]|uniref:RHS repeat-associated core domain-containing protein n=1 Tax=Accumulibacter sp. TaxID=2053492 RepID=UPI0025DC5F5A|nr:RHS repeat-associated core domain-containing protein [Accumulibacter sp.]MCM8594308.1 hypothetical protein [Accumulibacter sp.]MDS4048452.1 RHS repeat-associated core domain-containing protein [Accumulibacter sp.]